MIGWIILGVYVLGYIGFAPAMARILLKFILDGAEPDRGDLVMAAVLAMLVALFWPLVIPVGWIYRRAFGRRS